MSFADLKRKGDKMGRTLHYEVLNEVGLEDKRTMLKISEHYNSGKFKDVWTCENFYLDPWHFYPNWDIKDNSWEKVNSRLKILEGLGIPYHEAIIKMHDEGYVNFHSPGKIYGFTKVGGNEYNALLVYLALIDISRLTNAIISLRDEGEFLLVPVILEKGQAKIDIQDVKESWEYWRKEGWLDPASKNFNAYNTNTKMLMQKKLCQKYIGLSNPFALCRVVNQKDFEVHPEYGASQIMAGFEGEYYGLTDKDSEKESYKMLANFTKLISQLGYKDVKIEVGKKIKKS